MNLAAQPPEVAIFQMIPSFRIVCGIIQGLNLATLSKRIRTLNNGDALRLVNQICGKAIDDWMLLASEPDILALGNGIPGDPERARVLAREVAIANIVTIARSVFKL
jgi:hypothetical protein